jgi:hypothetical protein
MFAMTDLFLSPPSLPPSSQFKREFKDDLSVHFAGWQAAGADTSIPDQQAVIS